MFKFLFHYVIFKTLKKSVLGIKLKTENIPTQKMFLRYLLSPSTLTPIIGDSRHHLEFGMVIIYVPSPTPPKKISDLRKSMYSNVN